MTPVAPAPCREPEAGLRWLRILAIATGAIVLCSCRSLTTSLVDGGMAEAVVSDDHLHGDAVRVVPTEPSGEQPSGPTAAANLVQPPRPVAVEPQASWETALTGPQPAILRTGLEAPCPALPREGGCRECRGVPAPAGCGRCGPAAACRDGGCSLPACGSCDRLPPVAAGCLVCDGGDDRAPARPVGRDGLKNITAGDTVARYRPTGDDPDAATVRLTASNCACVFAPRFGSVRELVRPAEEAAPAGPRGLAVDTLVGERTDLVPVLGNTQRVAVEAARTSLPGLALEERSGPLAVDQRALPHEDDGRQKPTERAVDDGPELARRSLPPLVVVGFDVPIAWTCVKGANALLNGQAAETVAADRGTATLRFEEPGRAELTLCKRAGSDTARTGEELDFTIFVLNSGDRPLTDIVLVDALPRRLELIPRSPASSLPADITTEAGDDGSVVVKWRLTTTLPPGGSGFVRFRTIVR
jgi:uncharacterized repeat protein (TIGR01451 family)